MLSKVISQANIDHVEKWFERAEKIVIVTHVSPDGDAIGSSLGLWHFLESQEKNVNVIVPNAFPDFLRWMPGAKDIIRYDKYKEFADKLIAEADVICCLDFNALSRIDAMADAVAASKGRKMMVDHHLYPGDFCRIVISHPEISSTSELVFRLICRLGYFEDITKEGAECIYTGMMTDTGGFTYNSNNREIYFIISELLSKGIDKCSENRGHKGDSGHFGIMPYLDDLEIIGAESKCQSTNNGQPRIDPKCQHKKVKTDET